MTDLAPAPEPAARVDLTWIGIVLVVTAGWLAATVSGWGPPFDTTGHGTAAAAAAAAVVGAAWRARTARTAISAGFGLVLLPLALALAAGGSAALLVGTVTVYGAAEALTAVRHLQGRRRSRAVVAGGVVAAAGCLLAGVLLHGGDGISRPLPSGELTPALLGAVTATLLVLVANLGPPRTRPLVVPGLLVGIVAVAGLPELAVAGAGAAAATLAAFRAPDRPALALAALALAAAAVPEGGQASSLLAAAAALGVVFPHPASALLGIPGAAALASGSVATGADWPLVAVVVGTAAAALAVAEGARARTRPWAWRAEALHLLPACGLAVWLLLSPGSWRWTGASGLGTYDRGALVASAAGLLALAGCRALALSARATP